VTAVAFSPDGVYVVSGSKDSTLRLWEVASGRSHPLEGFPYGVRAVAFSPDGQHILCGGDKTLQLLEVKSGWHRRLEGHSDFILTVAFSPDGNHMLSGAEDHRLRLWHVASGQSRLLEGHTGWVTGAAFSPDGTKIVSCSHDRTLRLWEMESGHELGRFDGDAEFSSLSFASNGKAFAAGDAGGRVHLFDVLLDDADKSAWCNVVANEAAGAATERGSRTALATK
jgi:WD40 repeat protein